MLTTIVSCVITFATGVVDVVVGLQDVVKAARAVSREETVGELLAVAQVRTGAVSRRATAGEAGLGTLGWVYAGGNVGRASVSVRDRRRRLRVKVGYIMTAEF